MGYFVSRGSASPVETGEGTKLSRPQSMNWLLALPCVLLWGTASAQEQMAPKMRPGEDPFAVPSSPLSIEANIQLLKRTTPGAVLGGRIGSHTALPNNQIMDDQLFDNQSWSTDNSRFGYEPALFLRGRYTLWEDAAWQIAETEQPDQLMIEMGFLGFLNHRETSYLSADDQSLVSRFATPTANGWFTNLFPFDQANRWMLDYKSELHSAEMNFRWSNHHFLNFPIEIFAGARYLKLREQLTFGAASSVGNSSSGNYSVQTENDYFGLQVGGDLSYRLSSRFNLVGSGRGGLLLGSSVQRSSINGAVMANGNTFSEFGSASTIGFSRLFEFGLRTDVRVTSNMKLMLGYQGMIVTDMSLAPRQLNFNLDAGSRNHLDRNGNLFLFGPSAGVEIKW